MKPSDHTKQKAIRVISLPGTEERNSVMDGKAISIKIKLEGQKKPPA